MSDPPRPPPLLPSLSLSLPLFYAPPLLPPLSFAFPLLRTSSPPPLFLSRFIPPKISIISPSAAASLNDWITTICRSACNPAKVHRSPSRAQILLLTTCSRTRAQRKPLSDGIFIKTRDGQRRAYRGHGGVFKCPYPHCNFNCRNTPAFQVRVSGYIFVGHILTVRNISVIAIGPIC